MPRDSILVVRPTVQLDSGTPDAPSTVTAPNVPAGWIDYQVEVNGWITYWPRGRVAKPKTFVQVLLVADGLASGRACFFFQGPTNILDNIAGTSFRDWPGCPAMRADALTVAVNVRGNWYDQAHIGFVTQRVAGHGDTNGEARVNEDEPP